MTDGQSEAQQMMAEAFDATQAKLPSGLGLLTEYAALDKEKVALEDRLEEIAAKMIAMHRTLLDQMLETNTQRATVNGRTYYIRHDFVCKKKSGVDTRVLLKALRDAGLASLISEGYNASSLKSKVQVMEPAGLVPPALADCLFIETIPRIISTKA